MIILLDEQKTQCVICCKEIEVLDNFNGELMCQECYDDPDNEVYDHD